MQKFELVITKVNNGYSYTQNEAKMVQNVATDILKEAINAINTNLAEMKLGDKYLVSITYERQ